MTHLPIKDHACATGDCGHDNANDCVHELIAHAKENEAALIAERDELQNRVRLLEDTLAELRAGFERPCSILFDKHLDDFR